VVDFSGNKHEIVVMTFVIMHLDDTCMQIIVYLYLQAGNLQANRVSTHITFNFK
jgi:hypothetical protein